MLFFCLLIHPDEESHLGSRSGHCNLVSVCKYALFVCVWAHRQRAACGPRQEKVGERCMVRWGGVIRLHPISQLYILIRGDSHMTYLARC